MEEQPQPIASHEIISPQVLNNSNHEAVIRLKFRVTLLMTCSYSRANCVAILF
ncbi:hypothetical protein IQ268_13750 [Oculatella sp. LEGE 06141]|uniref:hypothetical protein n=1 Tax=Oculatella sp. LEGE 06141 TaxID=1828648 RepID=UPI001880B5B7|nr:hypothetical protein [Oculatella sp. LEGE 06141]MBE9179627.1 hypothetical protein [Oculatella sp. LEGE 06141]